MMLPLLLLFSVPICSIPAGLIVWFLNRNEQVEDSKLIRDFVIFIFLFTVALWQITKLHSVRMRFDPDYRIQVEIESNPVYRALAGMESESKVFREKLVESMHSGKNMQQAMLLMRPWLRTEATSYSGFADQKTRLMWANQYVATLKELQRMDSAICYKEIAQQGLDQQTLEHGFSSENSEAFQRAVIEVYQSALRGMGHERRSDERPADFNATALENNAINKDIDAQFGIEVSEIIRYHRFSAIDFSAAEKVCSARIFQLESMMQRPQATAALLVDSALRFH